MTEGMMMFGMGIVAGFALAVSIWVIICMWRGRPTKAEWEQCQPREYAQPEFIHEISERREVQLAQAEARRAGHNVSSVN